MKITIPELSLVVLIGSSFVTGSFGNRLYRAHVLRILAGGSEADAARARGGVSLPAAIGSFVAVAVLSALAGMVPAMIGRG